MGLPREAPGSFRGPVNGDEKNITLVVTLVIKKEITQNSLNVCYLIKDIPQKEKYSIGEYYCLFPLSHSPTETNTVNVFG